MAKYVGALDQGTTSTRFMIFDHAGQVVGIDQKEHEQIYPKPGWVEHDPAEIWNRASRSSGRARQGQHQRRRPRRRGHHEPARNDRRLGPPNRQGRSTTPSSGRTRAPTRSSTSSPRTAARIASAARTGLPLATYFSGPKIAGSSTTSRRTGGCRGRRRALRHHRHVAHLEPDRRRRTAAFTSPTSPTPAARC